MTIATSITESYLERSKPFFESIVKNFTGRKICFSIGFKPIIDGWEVREVTGKAINWKPENRKDYYSLQHGEFVDYCKFDNNEMILFCDSDMILQRKFDLVFEKENIYVTNNSYPEISLTKAIINIKGDPAAILSISQEKEFSAAWMCMSATNWRKVYFHTLTYSRFLGYFKHHAAWQVLINLVVHELGNMVWLGEHIQNAIWYSGTQAKKIGDKLIVGHEVVYFNHTKFNTEWKIF